MQNMARTSGDKFLHRLGLAMICLRESFMETRLPNQKFAAPPASPDDGRLEDDAAPRPPGCEVPPISKLGGRELCAVYMLAPPSSTGSLAPSALCWLVADLIC